MVEDNNQLKDDRKDPKLIQYAKASVGIKDGAIAGKVAIKWFVQKIIELDDELAVVEE